MPSPYLSKSDFKVGYDCAAKLRYKKARYPSNLDDNDYIQFLADGGFMIELLAKAKFPGGLDLVDERDQLRAFARTREALVASERVVIYEAAAFHERRLARIDILRREGDTLHLIEVKSSSVRSDEPDGEASDGNDALEEFLLKRAGGLLEPNAKWMPYLLDVTFQWMVLQAAFAPGTFHPGTFPPGTAPSGTFPPGTARSGTVPPGTVPPGDLAGIKHFKAWLCLVDKSAVARDCETLARFDLKPRAGDTPDAPRQRPLVRYLGDTQDLLDSKLVTLRDVTPIAQHLLPRVQARAAELLALIRPDGTVAPSPVMLDQQYRLCRSCEYRLSGPAATEAAAKGRHGFAECWGTLAATPHHILDLHRVTQIATKSNPDPVAALLCRGRASLLDLDKTDLGKEGPRRDRRLLQWTHSQGAGSEYLPATLRQTLAAHRPTPEAPLHFLDFEACNVALPHHAGLHPYERVAFQFSCHSLRSDEPEDRPLPRSVHTAWLNTDRAFPNFRFARALRDCLGETGIVYVWSPFEQSTLKAVLQQLHAALAAAPSGAPLPDGAGTPEEARDLAAWIDRLLGQETLVGKNRKRVSPRIRDLHALALEHYFHPEMAGRTSIKLVLPAIWRNAPAVHRHPWFTEYLQIGDDGRPLDPYKTLNPLPLGESAADEDVVADGSGAIRIYQDLLFRTDATPEYTNNRRALLEQYCKLDTAAMMMIWRHWRG